MLFDFMKHIWQMAWYWRIWIALLMLLNAAAPIFFIHTLEAKVILAIFMLSAGIQMYIFQQKGFVRLLGLGHMFWLPMVIWLILNHSTEMLIDFASLWLSMLIIVNSISLCIDVMDVWRYWRGERSEML